MLHAVPLNNCFPGGGRDFLASIGVILKISQYVRRLIHRTFLVEESVLSVADEVFDTRDARNNRYKAGWAIAR